MRQDEKGIHLDQRAEISESQKEEIEGWFSFSNYFDRCQTVRALTLECGNDFLLFCKSLSSHSSYNVKLANTLHLTANKLLINYLSFLRTFYDVIGNALSHQKGKDALERFHKYDSQLYDNHFSYRFLKFLRNYITHFDIPLSGLSFDLHGIAVYSESSALRRDEKWKKIEKEGERLPEKIDVCPYVEDCQGIIDQLYLNAIEHIFQDVYQSNVQFVDLCKKYKLNNPALLIANIEDPEAVSVYNLPQEVFRDYFEEINRHPNYNIKFTALRCPP